MPLVSVVMPFHQVTPYLRPAARSILDQTFRDLELLVVDNGTGAGLKALGEEGRDPRMRLITHAENLGVAAAHNAAQAVARGEFIANMDSDDIALPARLERQVAALRAEPALGLLATHALIIDDAGAVRGAQFTLATGREQRVFSGYSLPITNPSLMGRREVFERHPMRGELSICSDYDFFTRAIETHETGCLAEPLLHYRTHAGQVTQSARPAMVFNACLIRIITARRRSGRPEDVAGLLAGMGDWPRQPPPAVAAYRRFADLAIAEGFPLLAVFLARRTVSVDPRVPVLARALRVLAGAVARSPGESVRLVRMFATGPLRTHGLRPL